MTRRFLCECSNQGPDQEWYGTSSGDHHRGLREKVLSPSRTHVDRRTCDGSLPRQFWIRACSPFRDPNPWARREGGVFGVHLKRGITQALFVSRKQESILFSFNFNYNFKIIFHLNGKETEGPNTPQTLCALHASQARI